MIKSTRYIDATGVWDNERRFFTSGSVFIFLAEGPKNLCRTLFLTMQEKQGQNDSVVVGEETVAEIVNFFGYNCIITTQLIRCFINFKLIQVMLKLIESYQVDRCILECDWSFHSLASLNSIKQIFLDIAKGNSICCLEDSSLELNFGVLHAADHMIFAVGSDIRLCNFGPIALFKV